MMKLKHMDERLSKSVAGGLTTAINDHGPITHKWIKSATKRILGQILGDTVHHAIKTTIDSEYYVVISKNQRDKYEAQRQQIKVLSDKLKGTKQ